MLKPKNPKGEFYYKAFKSVNKEMLIRLTRRKIKTIKESDVKAVVNFFLNQLEEDLFKLENIPVGNFVDFNLKRMPAKRGRNYYTGEIVPTKPFNMLKIAINPKLNKKLMKYLDKKAYDELSMEEESKKDK